MGRTRRLIRSPFLTRLSLRDRAGARGRHPFDIPILRDGLELRFSRPITFFVGENGSGKSTLLEGIAAAAGFSARGGGREHRGTDTIDDASLGAALALTWSQKPADGFFLRAETFFNFATYLEEHHSLFTRFGGKSLHAQSHGEAFLSLFNHRFESGLFILDEPEAALSPQRQLAFLGVMHRLAESGTAQFIVASHSPMLLACPGAAVLSLDGSRIEPIDYRDTSHFQLMRDFLNAPEQYFRHLLNGSGSSQAG